MKDDEKSPQNQVKIAIKNFSSLLTMMTLYWNLYSLNCKSVMLQRFHHRAINSTKNFFFRQLKRRNFFLTLKSKSKQRACSSQLPLNFFNKKKKNNLFWNYNVVELKPGEEINVGFYGGFKVWSKISFEFWFTFCELFYYTM